MSDTEFSAIESVIRTSPSLGAYAPIVEHAVNHWDELRWGIRDWGSNKTTTLTKPGETEDVIAVLLQHALEENSFTKPFTIPPKGNGIEAAVQALADRIKASGGNVITPPPLSQGDLYDFPKALQTLAAEGHVTLSNDGRKANLTTSFLAKILHKAFKHQTLLEIQAAAEATRSNPDVSVPINRLIM